jgi:hypothetical protein
MSEVNARMISMIGTDSSCHRETINEREVVTLLCDEVRLIKWLFNGSPCCDFVSNDCDEIIGDIVSSLKTETCVPKEAKISKLKALYLLY